MSKTNVIQLNEFDVTQRIIEALTNVCTRAVLFSIKNESKDATQVADELKLSLSTVYKTLTQLEELALITIERDGQMQSLKDIGATVLANACDCCFSRTAN